MGFPRKKLTVMLYTRLALANLGSLFALRTSFKDFVFIRVGVSGGDVTARFGAPTSLRKQTKMTV